MDLTASGRLQESRFLALDNDIWYRVRHLAGQHDAAGGMMFSCVFMP